MFQQPIAPVGGSLGWSALVAALPLLLLFVLLGVFRVRAWRASLIGLAASLVVAMLVYRMPTGQAFSSAAEGVAFGLFPAMWIVVNAIWIYRMTVASGHFDVLRRSFASVSDDFRVQAIIIAFAFGALLEALAGFGAPVAICAVMLVALGLPPLKAATVALVANTAPVAYGAVALPVITLSRITGLPLDDVAAMTGRQVPFLAVIVPFVLLGLLDGRRGLREAWPAALVSGLTFGITQYLMANYGPVQLADIVASLVCAGCVLLLVRRWRPAGGARTAAAQEAGGEPGLAVAAGGGPGAARSESGGGPGAASTDLASSDRRADVLRAFAPYGVIIVLFALVALPPVAAALGSVTKSFGWPGVHVLTEAGKPLSLATFKFDWLANSGTVLFVAGLLSVIILGLTPAEGGRCYGGTLRQLGGAMVTVVSVLGMAYVLNLSGQTATLGQFLAGAGGLFALLSPVLGWFGTAVTGSDTSSNSLFGLLQVSAAQHTGMSPLLAAAGNTSGGVLGKMLSPQNLAIGASAVGLAGKEGDLLRRVLVATLILLPLMCLLVYLQSTPVLGWMVP
ncbi:MAG TPA: L-lactate permease [Pseudonocardia sp.]|uniref:L-lactate permease n=1 Tax=Pseudonocardia sp. TaxID=60912 RepID=UPI002B7C9BA4|nr:L-lactate permease [Pseudonocardia sp.]HTF51304.1 L-lactate permease [Pseudonocardia sp.]